MSIANPLNAGIEVNRANISHNRQVISERESKAKFGEFTRDVVQISQLGRQKQLEEKGLEATQEAVENTPQSVRVSSTIGRSQTMGNLTKSEATELYKDIAALL